MKMFDWFGRTQRLQGEVTFLRNELAKVTARRGEQAMQERLLASFRQLSDFSLSPATSTIPVFPKPYHDLMQKLYHLSFNPLANRILQIPVDLLHQYATPFQTEQPDEETVLREFWDDPVNNFAEWSRQIIYNYGLFGEQCFTVFVNPVNHRVHLGPIHPMQIEQTILDPDNPRIVIGVKLRSGDLTQTTPEILTTILSPDHNELDFSPETREKRADFRITNVFTQQRIQRHCFLFQEKPQFFLGSKEYGLSLRGMSDLAYLHDWILSTDDMLSSMIERADLLSRTLWTLQIKGGNFRDGDEYNLETLRQKFGKVPERWEVRVMNENMTYERHDGPVGNSDMAELLRAVELYVISGCGYPEHWFLGGVNANKASSLAMEFPTLKKLESRQHAINHIYNTLFRYQAIQAGLKPTFKLVNTPLKDTTGETLANAIKILSDSLVIAQTNNWVSPEEAQIIYRKFVQELGTQLKEHPKSSVTPQPPQTTPVPQPPPAQAVTPAMAIEP